MPRPTDLRIESLERRDQPSVFGNPWQQADKLTISFAPDGVGYTSQIRGQSGGTSTLFGELGGMAPSVWQEQMLRAVYAWTSQANLNVGLVPDTGTAFGPEGYSVHAPPADFRVGAVPLSGDVLAINSPFHPLTGERAGNVLLNTNRSFNVGGSNGAFDLYTVFLHEFGNALGLADRESDSGSALNGKYRGVLTGPNAADVTALRTMYGVRPHDAFEGTGGNNDLARASTLTPAADPSNTARRRVVADGNITTTSDVDVYRFTTPAGTTSLTVRLGTAGKSLLAGRVEVLNAAGQVVSSRTSTNPLTGDTVLTVTGAAAKTTFFVRVSAGRTDTFAVGTYQLRVGFNYDPVTETVVDPVQRLGADNNTNNTRQTATALASTPGFAANTHYEASARIESKDDLDFYRVVAPTGSGVMTITTRTNGALSAAVQVFDAAGNPVTSNTLLSWEGGLFRTQVASTVAGATYFVRAAVNDPAWSAWTGDYLLDVDFLQPLAQRSLISSGTATATSRNVVGIEVREAAMFSFSLTASSTNLAGLNWVDVTIYDDKGNRVALFGTDGKASVDTQTVFLQKGKYTLVVDPIHSPAGGAATATYQLRAALLSDPIDVYDPLVPPPPPTSPPFTVVTVPPASPPPPGFYDPWSCPVP
jgi:hypothetical protein